MCWTSLGMTSMNAWSHADLEIQIAALTEKIGLEPNNAQLYLQRGELYREHRDWNKAEADYDRAAKNDPKLVGVDLARANLLFDRDQPDAAGAVLTRFLEKNPANESGLVLRARVSTRLGHFKNAIEDYTRAIGIISIPPPELYIERAQAQIAAGDVNDALRGLEEGRKKLGTVITLELCALDIETNKRDFDAALIRLDRIASLSPRKETWLARRGNILEKANRAEDARKAYEDSLAAIDRLPPRFRHTKAVEDLEARVRASLQTMKMAADKSKAAHAP